MKTLGIFLSNKSNKLPDNIIELEIKFLFIGKKQINNLSDYNIASFQDGKRVINDIQFNQKIPINNKQIIYVYKKNEFDELKLIKYFLIYTNYYINKTDNKNRRNLSSDPEINKFSSLYENIAFNRHFFLPENNTLDLFIPQTEFYKKTNNFITFFITKLSKFEFVDSGEEIKNENLKNLQLIKLNTQLKINLKNKKPTYCFGVIMFSVDLMEYTIKLLPTEKLFGIKNEDFFKIETDKPISLKTSEVNEKKTKILNENKNVTPNICIINNENDIMDKFQKWSNGINPLTGRAIKKDGKIYNKLGKDFGFFDILNKECSNKNDYSYEKNIEQLSDLIVF